MARNRKRPRKRTPVSAQPKQSPESQAANSAQQSSPGLGLIYLCVLLSGMAALVYEIVWARSLTLFIGTTAYAHTAVLTAYMTGLALGSLVVGRVADRISSPLKLYAWLEIGIGVFAVFTPWLFPVLQQFYADTVSLAGLSGTSGQLMRFGIALLLLLIPTFLMGGTLPLLVKGLTRRPDGLLGSTARLYGLNTLGATLGAFAAGYLLIPTLGLKLTIYFAVVVNVLVGLLILVLRTRHETRLVFSMTCDNKLRSQTDTLLTDARLRWVLIGFAFSGFAALVYQTAWIKSLILVIGGSVYGFTITVTTFLAGIGIGSLAYSWWAKGMDQARTLRLAAGLQFGVAVTALIGMGLIGTLPELFFEGYRAGLHTSFYLFQAYIFLLCFIVMFVPTVLLGALFPLIVSVWTRANAIGQGVGTAYAANAFGTIIGALLGGLLLLPTIGIQASVILASLLSALVAVLFWFIVSGWSPNWKTLAWPAYGLATVGLTIAIMPSWDRQIMTSGAYTNSYYWAKKDEAKIKTFKDRIKSRDNLYYHEGIDGLVNIYDGKRQRVLVINGKAQASTRGDLPTQILLAQLPMMLRPDATEVLNIGLGAGISAGSVTLHQKLEQLDIVEFSSGVVEGNHLFNEYNHSVLDNPKVKLYVMDGRNFILANKQKYDVIVSEPSHPWISGVSNLFTREFMEAARDQLKPGGILSQWIQTYAMDTDSVKILLNTVRSTFDYVSVWLPRDGDLIVIASNQPYFYHYPALVEQFNDTTISEELARIKIENPVQLMNKLLFQGSALASYTRQSAINSDDDPIIEYQAPRALFTPTANQNLNDTMRFLDRKKTVVPIKGLTTVVDKEMTVIPAKLAIALNGDEQKISSQWLAERRHLKTQKELSVVGTGNQWLSKWTEGKQGYQVLSERRPRRDSELEQQALLRSVMVKGVTDNGLIENDKRHPWVAWVVGPGISDHHQALSLLWACEDPQKDNQDSVLRHLVQVQIPVDQMRQQSNKALVKKTQSRFQCLSGQVL